MLSCPIYVTYSDESVIELDLFPCTRMFDKVLPIDYINDIRENHLRLNWSEKTFHSQCLQYEKHNTLSKNSSIILATGE
jgi:hypothetical protein